MLFISFSVTHVSIVAICKLTASSSCTFGEPSVTGEEWETEREKSKRWRRKTQRDSVCVCMHVRERERECCWFTHFKAACIPVSIPAHVLFGVIIIIIIIIQSFYIALFSALEQTRCAHWHVILNESHHMHFQNSFMFLISTRGGGQSMHVHMDWHLWI